MPRLSRPFVRDVNELVARIGDVATVLEHYGAMCADLATHVERGRTLLEAFDALDGPIGKRDVTTVLEDLGRARHRVRVSLFVLAEEEGMSASEVARQLGVSRQLASRLAKEARAERSGAGRSTRA
jgi:hypothetical protein